MAALQHTLIKLYKPELNGAKHDSTRVARRRLEETVVGKEVLKETEYQEDLLLPANVAYRALIKAALSGVDVDVSFPVTVSTAPEADTMTTFLEARAAFSFSAMAAQTAKISSLSKS